MKKNQTLNILFILLTTIAFGQNDCENLKIENQKLNTAISKTEKIVVSQTETITKLDKDIHYYKETLKLLNSKISTKTKEVTFKITAAKGDSNTAEVLVEGLMINNGGLRFMQTARAEAFDIKGNSLKPGALLIGPTRRVDKLFNDVPTKFTVVLKNVSEETPMIKSLMVEFYSKRNGPQEKVMPSFKNIPVIWE